MNRATRAFVRSSTSVADGKATVSKLFEWYAKDFEAAEGSVKAYLAKYLKEEQKAALESATLGYSNYDWKLNLQ